MPCSSSGPATGQEDDVFMTKHHKQLLGENRNRLVENMFPDDILNLLVSSKVLSGREVTRIKEKGNIDAMNECLLDFLVRKPDRAFMEFVNALRNTDQGHVASLLVKRETPLRRGSERPAPRRISYAVEEEADEEDDRGTLPGQHKAKRPTLGVRIEAVSLTSDEEDEDVLAPRPAKRSTKESRLPREEALTKAINNEILETSLTELRNLKRIVRAGISPKTMTARKRILETLSELARLRREIVGVEDGSVVFRVMCPTLEALNDLWEICTSGKLRRMFVDAYVKEEHRGNITINVTVDKTEWQRCRQQLLPPEPSLVTSTEDSPIAETDGDCQPKHLQRKKSDNQEVSVVESPRGSTSCPLSNSSSGFSSSSLPSSDSDNSNPCSTRCYSSFEELPPDNHTSPHSTLPCQNMENG